MPNDDKLRCSFCGRSQDEVNKLIQGVQPGIEVYICDECVKVCCEIISDAHVMRETISKDDEESE